MDAGDALVYSPRLGVKAVDNSTQPGGALNAIFVLAAGYALLVLISAWRRRGSRLSVILSACWLGAVTILAALAVRGIRPILAEAPVLSSAAVGQWVIGPGVFMAFGGLLVAWVGLALLWRAMAAQRKGGASPGGW
ncbi:MAG: hypothetical protein IVW57_07230 [Ktedonobacterales bacterium]|nr:hypothetical protein [Ktedonobacterales bacterium]